MISGKIHIGEYGPHEDPLGYIEPIGDNPSWIMWYYQDGHAQLYLNREPSGAAYGDPIHLPAPTAVKLATQSVRTSGQKEQRISGEK